MLVNLIKDFKTTLVIENSRETLNCSINIPTQISQKDNQQESEASAAAYHAKLATIIRESAEYGSLNYDVEFKPSGQRQLKIRLDGPLLKKLQDLCGQSIKMWAEMKYILVKDIFTDVVFINLKQVTGSTVKSEGMPIYVSLVEDKGICYQNRLPYPYNIMKMFRERQDCFGSGNLVPMGLKISISVYFSVDHTFINDGGPWTQIPRRIRLARKVASRPGPATDPNDMIPIVARQNKRTTFHKRLLSEHSRILAGLCRNPRSTPIDMTDVSEECVDALKAFMYTGDVTSASNSSKLAAELLKTAIKYEVDLLVGRLTRMLWLLSPNWYDKDSALEIFLTIRNDDRYDDLKLKLIRVLKTKADGNRIVDMETFGRILQGDYGATLELASLALQVN